MGVVVVGSVVVYQWLGPAPSAPADGPRATPSPVARPASPEPAARESAPVPPRRAERSTRAAAPEPVAPAPEAAPTTSTLHVEADVPDAKVFVDRIGRGTAPVTIADLAPGPHRVNVTAAGYDGYSEDVELAPGSRTLTVTLKDVRLDVAMEVTHKHGMGSCKGRLSASPKGLAYEASDGNDSFLVPFTEVTALELDYLAKDLRVKTKNGKTFNFTDGSADRLATFHQDVNKARTRLAAQ
jgi:hypothetical protein